MGSNSGLTLYCAVGDAGEAGCNVGEPPMLAGMLGGVKEDGEHWATRTVDKPNGRRARRVKG